MERVEFICKRWRLFVLPLVVIIFCLLALAMVVLPQFKKVTDLNQQLKIEREKLVALGAKLADLEGIDEMVLGERVSFSLSALPKNKDVMKTISLFNGLAQLTQTQIDSLEVSPGEIATESPTMVDPDLENLTFRLKFSGENSQQLVDFLNQIEQSLPLMNITTFRLNTAGDFSPSQLTVVSYFSSIPSSLDTIDAPLKKVAKEDELILDSIKDYKKYQIVLMEVPEATGTSSVRTDPFAN